MLCDVARSNKLGRGFVYFLSAPTLRLRGTFFLAASEFWKEGRMAEVEISGLPALFLHSTRW